MEKAKKMERLEREFLEVFPESKQINWITNKAGIVGVIEEDFEFSHEVHDGKFFKTFVTTYRLSGVEDHVPVILSEKILDMSKYAGNYVKILGDFRSFNVHDEEGKSHLKLFLFGKQITRNPAANATNRIYLKGFVCKEPIFRTTPSGRTITELIIAVNRNYGNSDYIPCITWGHNAWDADMLQVGDAVQLWGRIQSRDYFKVLQDHPNGGEVRQAYEISITRIEKN